MAPAEITTTDSNPELTELLCIHCVKARFPEPQEQCYKCGGLICTVDNTNVEKYQKCKFPAGVGETRK